MKLPEAEIAKISGKADVANSLVKQNTLGSPKPKKVQINVSKEFETNRRISKLQVQIDAQNLPEYVGTT